MPPRATQAPPARTTRSVHIPTIPGVLGMCEQGHRVDACRARLVALYLIARAIAEKRVATVEVALVAIPIVRGAPRASLPFYQKTLVLRDTPSRAPARKHRELRSGRGGGRVRPRPSRLPRGEAGPTLYVVASGVIALCFVAHRRCASLPSACSAPPQPSRANSAYSARAAPPSILLDVPNEDYYDQSEEHREFTRGAMARLATRARGAARAPRQNRRRGRSLQTPASSRSSTRRCLKERAVW